MHHHSNEAMDPIEGTGKFYGLLEGVHGAPIGQESRRSGSYGHGEEYQCKTPIRLEKLTESWYYNLEH